LLYFASWGEEKRLDQFDLQVGDLPGIITVIQQCHFSHILTKGIKHAPDALFL
jgi:hypothetical protein